MCANEQITAEMNSTLTNSLLIHYFMMIVSSVLKWSPFVFLTVRTVAQVLPKLTNGLHISLDYISLCTLNLSALGMVILQGI